MRGSPGELLHRSLLFLALGLAPSWARAQGTDPPPVSSEGPPPTPAESAPAPASPKDALAASANQPTGTPAAPANVPANATPTASAVSGNAGSAPRRQPVYETTVTSLRLPRPLPDVPNTVTVLTRDEIDTTPALATDELVRALPTVATFRRSSSLTADPTSQGLTLRGLAPSGVSRALVLLDGVPVTQAFGGWIYWQALPRLGIDRVEVVPGGTSALFGNTAMGGVIQMFSRPIANRVEAEAALGNFGLKTASVAAGYRYRNLGVAVEAEGTDFDGYVQVAANQRGAIDQPAWSRHGAINARVAWDPSEATRVGAQFRVFEESENGGTPLTTGRPSTQSFGLTFEHAFENAGALTANAFLGWETFLQGRSSVASDRSSEALADQQQVKDDSQGGSVVFTSRPLEAAGAHTLMIGADAFRVSGTADDTLFPAVLTDTSTVHRAAGGEQRFVGIFAQDVYDPAQWIEASFALRFDRWSNVDGERTVRQQSGTTIVNDFADRSASEINPRLGLLLKPAQAWRIRAAGYTAFRAPTLSELYRPFQVGTVLTAANENLTSEHLLGADLGLEYLFTDLGAVRVTGFVNRLDDPILSVTLAQPINGATQQRQNLGKADVRGIESSLDVRPFRHFIASLSYDAIDARVVEADTPALQGKRLPQDPVHRGRAEIRYVDPHLAFISVQVRAQSAQYEDALNTLPMRGFAVVDLFAALPLYRGLEAYGLVQNLFDTRYLVGRPGVDTIGPPRLLLAGFRLR